MRLLRCITVMLLTAIAARVNAQKISVDYDHSASFQGYKTYTWTSGTMIQNELWDQRIIEGVDQQMTSKGFRRVADDEHPDLYVLYRGSTEQQSRLNTTNLGGWGLRRGGGMATTSVDRIQVGQLIINIEDAKTKKLLWMANSSDTLSNKPEKNSNKLEKALAKMFKEFPPRGGR